MVVLICDSAVSSGQRCESAGAWNANACGCALDTRPDQGPARGEVHDLASADAAHRVHAGLSEEGAMRVGTQRPIRHEHIPGF
jgi:hypothetical protein